MNSQIERFKIAMKTEYFSEVPLMHSPGYAVWEVIRVVNGQHEVVDGPFFTEEEARISASLLKPVYRSAKASGVTYDRFWNYDPEIEKGIASQALQSRKMLGRQLGVTMDQ